MAMRNYAYTEYGMVLDNEAERAIKERRPDIKSLDDLADRNLCEFCFDFNGEAYHIDDDGNVIYFRAESYDFNSLFYFALRKFPSLCECAYESVDEIVDEIRERTQYLLPPDFDIRSRLRFISGTYYG